VTTIKISVPDILSSAWLYHLHKKKSQRDLGRAASPPLTAENNYATKFPLVTMRCSIFNTNCPPSTISTPSNTFIHRPTPLNTQTDPISRFPQFSHRTDRQTDRLTDRHTDRQLCEFAWTDRAVVWGGEWGIPRDGCSVPAAEWLDSSAVGIAQLAHAPGDSIFWEDLL